MNWVFLLISTSLSCHSARRACPELQNSHFKKRRKTFTHGESCQSGRMRGMRKCFCLALNQFLQWSPFSRMTRVIYWIMDSATSPSASRRMTEWGGILRRVKVLGIEKLIIERNQPYRETNHTNQKGNWCYLYGFLIDTGYIVFWLVHVLIIQQKQFESCRL